jgi:NAD(P)-dependent dehydrogenase (short-subunit alcohol dehydrogenase family)
LLIGNARSEPISPVPFGRPRSGAGDDHRRQGKIINVDSVQWDVARPTIVPCTAAKGGIRNLTRAMAAEWGGFDIEANALAPGYIPYRDDPEPG